MRMVALCGWAVLVVLLMSSAATADYRAPSDKVDISEPDFIEQIFGPTDVNGVCGNGRLAVGVNRVGTVTVIKWPRPSFHDQLRYRTISRDLPRLGARENDGLFLGLVFRGAGRMLWLRDAPLIEQTYLTDTNVLVTNYAFEDEGISVLVADAVLPGHDVLVRHVEVDAKNTPPSSLVAFANLRLCRFKIPYAPVGDWLFDATGRDRLAYAPDAGMLTQVPDRNGPGDPVAAAMGFLTPLSTFQCGIDGSTGDAYQDAADGVLSGAARATGHVDAAMTTDLVFDRGKALATFFVAFAPDVDEAIGIGLDLRRQDGTEWTYRSAKADWEWLAPACLPDTDDPDLQAVSRRALLVAHALTDARSGAIGCSVATQPPYAPDWSRDGTYVNRMLDAAGYWPAVSLHNRFYARVQRLPLGNWDMCMYGDGVPAGPLFLELDTLGLTAWNQWIHYTELPEGQMDAYLADVYDSIARAADFFTWWKNPVTGLPLPAFESDFVQPKSTLLSAGSAWVAVRVAQQAGEIIGETTERMDRWTQRRIELEAAIEEHYFDPQNNLFIGDVYTQAYMVHAFAYLESHHPVVQATADALMEWMEPILAGQTKGGSYLGLITLALVRAWRDDPEGRDKIEQVLDFLVHALPTAGTLHYGECFVTLDDRFDTRTGIPHVMSSALTFLVAAELYGVQCPQESPEDPDDDDEVDDDDEPLVDGLGDGDDDDADRAGCGC